MRELTAGQMAEIEGKKWGMRGLAEGFLCGAGVVGLVAIWMSPEPVSRWALWGVVSEMLGTCTLAFFG